MIEEPKYRIVTNANRRKILEIIDVLKWTILLNCRSRTLTPYLSM